MKNVLLWSLVVFAACHSDPEPVDPQLLAAAERTMAPNTSRFVTDGELASGIYFVVDSGYGYPRADMYDLLYIDPSPIVTVGNFTRIHANKAMDGSPEVRIEMDATGAARWQVATRKARNKKLAIVVNNAVVSAPIVLDEIRGGSTSIGMGQEGVEAAERCARLLNEEKPHVAPVR